MTKSKIEQITAEQAWPLLADDNAVLVDCRSMAEWAFVGIPDLSGINKDVITIEWTRMNGQPNPAFLPQLEAQVAKDKALFLICRAGPRSNAAAAVALEAGYAKVFNISDGFEGDRNADGQRKSVNGWCHVGLPWNQD